MIHLREREFAERVVALILGVDELYRGLQDISAQGLAREGYVAINLSQTQPQPVRSYHAAREAVSELRDELKRIDLGPGRGQYFGDYLNAIGTFCHWQEGHDISYPRLVRDLLGVPEEPPSLEPLVALVDQALKEAGYHGETVEMIARFRERRRLPRDQVVPVLEGYLAEAREWVKRELFDLPADFQFRVVGETGVPYNAYCAYVEREIRINLDLPFTPEDLKHLACHEAYPGHSTQMFRHEELVARGEMTEDGLLVVTDTPTTPLFEGIGEIGLTLLGWDQTEAEKINQTIIRLLAAVGAWGGYLFAAGKRDEGMELLRLYGGTAWAEARKELLDLPIRGPFIFAYFYGDQIVRSALDAAQDQKAFLHHLYDLNHSPASLVMA